MKLSTAILILTACLPLLGQAQDNDKEALRHCLATEQEGLSRFKNLEKRADELRGTEKLLLERRAGQIAPQGWEFYAITGTMFLTLAFPGFVYRYLLRRHHS